MKPGNDNALTTGGTAQGVEGVSFASSPNCHQASHSRQALRTIEGEQQARVYLARLQAQRVDVDELAATIAMLRDAVSLAGFCRVIEKALGVRHG